MATWKRKHFDLGVIVKKGEISKETIKKNEFVDYCRIATSVYFALHTFPLKNTFVI